MKTILKFLEEIQSNYWGDMSPSLPGFGTPALSRRNSTYGISISVVWKLKPSPPQHKLQNATAMQILNRHLINFLLNRLSFFRIDFILEWYDLTNCKKRRKIKITFSS